MKSPITRADVSLGGPDAWESLEGEHLAENFLPIRQFVEICHVENTFLSGRRGSGKSAIARMLGREAKWTYRRVIQGEYGEYGEYMNIVSELARYRDAGSPINVKEAVRRLWAWALPVVAMQTIVTGARGSGRTRDGDIRSLEDYLESLPHGINVDSSIGHLLAHTFGHARRLVETGDFHSALLDLVSSREHVAALRSLERITSSESVLMVFDTLESYRVFQPLMLEGFQGVLEAVVAFLADPQVSGVSIKFFLPAEIYEEVMYGFPGKVQSRTVFLRWRAADLFAMLARRFLSVVSRAKAVSGQELARMKDLVDQAYVENSARHLLKEFWYDTGFLPRMIVDSLGKEEDTFAYILRHTMRRPRDLITAEMQSIINAAVERSEFPRISAQSVVDGVHNPSALLQILKESLMVYDEGGTNELVDVARTVFYGNPVIMTGRELKLFAKEVYDVCPPEGIDPRDFVKHLLRCGLIGLLEDRAVDPRPSAVYLKARFEHLMRDHLPLADRFTYCVHPVMAEAFNMRPDSERAVYPLPADDLWLERGLGIVEP